MHCPNCRHERAPAARFCSHCGTPLALVCPQCQSPITAQDRFCAQCGAAVTAAAPVRLPASPGRAVVSPTSPLSDRGSSVERSLVASAEGENRLVTVLFADMSRSVQATAALQPEDAATLVDHLLRVMVEIVLRFEGRVDRFLGDGLLAVFGAPHAHEDDPERAIRAALEIRDAARELGLQVTAGLNTGEVYFGVVGPQGHQEVTVMGPVVNLASRLQGQAAPEEILVGEATHRSTRRAFAFASRTVEVRGLADPVLAYAVERALPRSEKVRGIEGLQAALVGREEELAGLRGALAQAMQGQGQLVTVIGEAGLGKSRLLAELKAACSSQDLTRGAGPHPHPQPCIPTAEPPSPLWLEGRCHELGMGTSYGPFLDLLRSYVGWRMEEPESARGSRFHAALRELVDRSDLSQTQAEEIAAFLGRLLSLRLESDVEARLAAISPEQLKQRTFGAIRGFLAALARQQPLVLVLEDLHWADRLSLDLVLFLTESFAGTPLLIVGTYRPEGEHPCRDLGRRARSQFPERCTEVVLRELGPLQSRQLIRSLLDDQDPLQAVPEAILARSGGNPFYIEEVVRSLIEAGMVHRDGERWLLRPEGEALSVPESVQSVIWSRVDRLAPELRQVLQCAAVIGRLFSARLLAQMVSPDIDLHGALDELQTRALVVRDQTIAAEAYAFRHALTQETVYHGILRRHRIQLHQQVAEAIEQLHAGSLEPHYEALAHHYVRSGVTHKALDYLYQAGEKAKRASANEVAAAHFEQALAMVPALPDSLERSRHELRLQIGLGASLIPVRGAGSRKVEQTYARARELCVQLGEQRLLFPVLWGLWTSHSVRAEHTRSRELAAELLELACQVQDRVLLLTAHRALGATLLWLGELVAAREHLEAALALYDREQHHSLTSLYGADAGVFSLSYLAMTLWQLGYPEQAQLRSEAAIALAREVPHPFSLALAMHVAAVTHKYRREAPLVQTQAQALIELASRYHFPLWHGTGTVLHGWALSEQGACDAGVAQMHEGLATWQATGAGMGRPYLLSLLAEGYGRAGAAADALSVLDEALAASERSGERTHEADLYRLRGELLLAVSSPAEAEACFRQAIEIARRQQAKSRELRAAISTSRLLQQLGRPAEARELLSPVYDWFTEGFETADLQEARALLAAIP